MIPHVPLAEPPDEECPLILTAGRPRPNYHTGTQTTFTNMLTSDLHDPITETPEFKACAVRVEKLR